MVSNHPLSANPPTAAELYRVYGPLVLRRARAMLADEQAARDAAHDVFVKVFASLTEFRSERALSGIIACTGNAPRREETRIQTVGWPHPSRQWIELRETA